MSGAAVAIGVSNSSANRVSRYMGAAERYLSEMNYEQAVIEFQRVLEIEPMNVDAYLGLAEAYLAIEQTDKAIEILKEGLDKTGDERIKNRLDDLRKPLTVDELSWIVEPTYEFDDIRPLLQDDFVYSNDNMNGANKLMDGLPGYEASFPSYSFTDAYYEIKRGDSYSLFYMPDNIISPFDSIYPLIVSPRGIYFSIDYNKLDFDQFYAKAKFPWNVAVIGASGGGLFGGVIWDSFTQKAYLNFYDLEYWAFKPASTLLNKNYPVQKFDLSVWRTVPQSEMFRIWVSDSDYDKLLNSAINEPVDSKYALWSPEDKLLTDFIYDDMSVCSYGLTAACRNGKWGYLDETGNEITDFVYDAPWCTANYSDNSRYAACLLQDSNEYDKADYRTVPKNKQAPRQLCSARG